MQQSTLELPGITCILISSKSSALLYKTHKAVVVVTVAVAVVLVHGQVTIIFVVSVGLFVCLFVCAEFFSAVFDPISIKLGHMLYVWV